MLLISNPALKVFWQPYLQSNTAQQKQWKKQKFKGKNKRSVKNSRHYLEPLGISQLINKEGRNRDKSHLQSSINNPILTRFPGPLPRGRALLPLDPPWTGRWWWVTVPATTACHPPQSGRWHCTGRWQTGLRWLPHSESAGSGEFWLHEEREWKIKLELCHLHLSCLNLSAIWDPSVLFTFKGNVAFDYKNAFKISSWL